MKSLIQGTLCLCVAALATTANVWAGEALITAQVQGSTFVNTTPKASYCNIFASGRSCQNLWTVDLPVTYRKLVDVRSGDDRDKVYIKLPPRQALTLQNQSTGQTATMSIAFQDVSQRVSYLHERVVGTRPINCTANGGLIGGPRYSQFLWYTTNTTNPPACISDKAGNAQVEDSEFTLSGVSFRPEFPAAASLAPGRWEGVIDYPVGMGQGFDFGNLVSTDASVIRFRVRFEVLHEIRVDFPAHGTQVELTPDGKWDTNRNTSRVPRRLYHDSPLRLWAGSPFSVYLACEYPSVTRDCILQSDLNTHRVPASVAISLPGSFVSDGQPVARLPLLERVENARIITPTATATNAPGTLHFEVDGAGTAQMQRYPGAKYSGAITIIYDANP
ncbi:hypothetical protein SOM59_12300 [Pseudomonas coleopterorum]|uniref:hypothetical protein n=1 Tax=Pseudomonas coleopterorum TaxID=1605838 RepID=UPI000F050F1B|nr:hypothetical protein [Pseudomonas coleopterorum]MBD8483268.1 hypothetical protein [Pseudomonas coleopterorum]MDY1017875.1 hypothetical protein [Pseudomonas coleopterorum]